MTEPADATPTPSVEKATRMPVTTYRCRICDGEQAVPIGAREMMYGTREVFRYFECRDCGCVQIAEIPGNLSQYYPDGYYSLSVPRRTWRRRVKVPIYRGLLAAERAVPPLGRVLYARHQELQMLALYEAATRGDRTAAILDVGSGIGILLEHLVDIGYRNAAGIDLYIAADRHYRGRTLVQRTDIFAIEGRFDVISFNHSFEHMPDQQPVLDRARDLLAENGCIILRLPIVGGEAWERYREDWVQLDPPRHLYLHSLPSLGRLAARAGLGVIDLRFDSTAFQFWGSELYRRDIPLLSRTSPAVGGNAISRAEMAAFTRRARAVNRAGRGDQIAARLVKIR